MDLIYAAIELRDEQWSIKLFRVRLRFSVKIFLNGRALDVLILKCTIGYLCC